MRNWKELGEVPDSDEESLDSPDSQDEEIEPARLVDSQCADHQAALEQEPVNEATTNIRDIPPTPDEQKHDDGSKHLETAKPSSDGPTESKSAVDDIWDLPSSTEALDRPVVSHEEARQTLADYDGPPFSPLSSPPSDIDDRDDVDEIAFLPTAPAGVQPRHATARSHGTASAANGPVIFEEDEISTPCVTITAPLPGRPASSPGPASHNALSTALSTKVPTSTTPPLTQPRSSALVVELPAGTERNDSVPEWDEAPTRGRRSLRPRKPIQQHPYLLESVQYAHVMKSHGVKPVKVVMPEASQPRRIEDDDSQDREFEEHSSDERINEGPLDITDESQPLIFDDMDDDRDYAGLSPSPPRTSPRNMLENSSQRSEAERTDNTSILDDDFPAIEDLVRRPPRSKARHLKRQLSSKVLPQSKRVSIEPVSASQSASPAGPRYRRVRLEPPSSPVAPSQDLGVAGTPRFSTPTHAERPAPIDTESIRASTEGRTSISARPTPARKSITPRRVSSSGRPRPPVVDLTNQDGDGDSSGSETSSTSSSSKSGSEVIRRNGKRIRGVLPASWLRIDQQKNTQTKPPIRRSPEPSPEPTLQRRGVAIRKVPSRVSSPRPATSTLPLFSDDSDDDDDDVTTIVPVTATRLSSPDESPLVIWSDQDDAGSVVEEDQIDRMFVGTKRKRSSFGTTSAAKKPKTTHKNPFKGQPGTKRRQPRITDILERTSSKTSAGVKTSSKAKRKHRGSHKSSHVKAPPRRAITPPLLSVLDAVDSTANAPPFLKIAARTAKKRQDLGKASPTHKHINLGTRRDNVDALSVLRDWKSGRIRPKSSKPKSKPTTTRPPLRNLSTNSSPRLTRESGALQPSVSDGESVRPGGNNVTLPQKPQAGTRKTAAPTRTHSWSAHPAQLETEEMSPSVSFHAWKRALDVLYRKEHRASSASSLRLERLWDSICEAHDRDDPVPEPPPENVQNMSPNPPRKYAKSRFRKRVRPKPVDLQAAHYTHANDPLPLDELLPQEKSTQEPPEERPPADKLVGLAPYGTKYTYHFEVFPLDRGVYFHSSSLVGAGWIHKISEPLYPEKTRQVRTRCSFGFDGKSLRWGPWDATTSSELGILVDWIAEQLILPIPTEVEARGARPQEGATFLLSYVVDCISFADEDSVKAFLSRSIEVMDGFLARVDEARVSGSALLRSRGHDFVEVLTCLTLVMQAVYRISDSTMSLKLQVEALLVRTAKSCIAHLLADGLEDLRTLYGDLQRLSARECGIRSHCTAANSWVVLMRVLETACIPRSSFWDITQAVMAGSNAVAGSDARSFENLWRDMFTLLPLSEVDDFGVVKSGSRYSAPVEGWNLPQKLLKRVFGLYAANPRQAPSFNEYCRALAARCHYLVQEWGWRKCAGIIGTWFDFFGSHNLSHLRNEEVYKSPRFLGELNRSTSLTIDPEDRCFHIFLKILALAIQRLKKLGLTNDIKNLVARTLPNHNRQYLKEDTVHQRDLAALRNHHDLLCTLFWAAPSELRPGVHLIEKLVSPGSSHKEACLINMRAWSQLARFVVTSDEGSAAFKPFVSWQNNIFGQVLDQYLSAESDIQQQILALPKDGPRIGDEAIKSMVKQNRSVAMDMLFVSLKSSFEVLKLAGSLGAATYALNIYQLHQTISRFDFISPDFDWSIVNLAFDTLEHYVSRVEKAEPQYSSDSTDMADSQHYEEAVLLLDHNLAEKLFSMGRTMMELPALERASPTEMMRCIEKAVKLSARVACRFIHSGITRTAKYFTPGKYGLFRELPLKLGSPQRKFLPLFVATLIQNHVYDFKDVGATLFQLWMVAIVKPKRAMSYENHLAEILKQRNLPYLQEAIVLPGVSPDYQTNFELFQNGMSHMRKELRKGGSTEAKKLREEYAKTLQTTMQKMREDLVLLRPDRSEHRQYMDFVRRIIALIKSHGVGICVVDSFFTQPSADYSPPMEDPQLHTAGIIAYGVKIGEGDSMAVSQVFYYLLNNFKVALINDKLDEEVTILERAMSNSHIFTFILTRALPAIIWATSKIYEAWPFLDVYLAAVTSLLARSVLSKEISQEDLPHVAALFANIQTWFRTLRSTSDSGLTKIQLHIMAQLMDLAAVLQPSLLAHLCSSHGADDTQLQQSYYSMARFASEAGEYLDDIFQPPRRNRYAAALGNPDLLSQPPDIRPPPLSRIQIRLMCRGIADLDTGPVFQSGRELDPQVDGFANEIVRDVRNNWVVTANTISLNVPARGGGSSMASTQSGTGTRYELLKEDRLFEKLRGALGAWIPEGGRRRGRGHRRGGVVEQMVF